MVNGKYFTNLTTFYMQTNTWKKIKNILLQNKQRVYILVVAMGVQNPISKHLLAMIIKEKLDI